MHKWYGSPIKGTSVLTLNQSLFFSKIGVCFFENRSLFFFENRSLFFLKIGVCFFENRSLFFKNRSLFFENRGLIFGNRSLSFLKIGVCFVKNRICFLKIGVWKIRVLAPDSALSFCSWVRTKSVADPGEEPGGPPPLFLDQTEAPKNFLETVPLLISGSGWPPPNPLSEGLYSSFRQEISDLEDLFKSLKLRIPAC